MHKKMVRLTGILLAVLLAVPIITITGASAQGPCGTAPAPRLTVAQNARVTISDGTGNNLRASADTGATVLGVLADGEVVNVTSGPQCAENYWWWEVRRWDGQSGWTAEGVTGDYWIEPWPVAGAPLATGPRPDLPNVLIAYLGADTAGAVSSPYVMQVSDGSTLKVAEVAVTNNVIAWSPDGTRLALTDGVNLYAVNADGTGAAPVVTGPGTTPTWSPDGMRLAYASETTGDSEILSVFLPNNPALNLTNDPGDDVDPDWSPDGTRIAFASDRQGNMDIYTMSAADGSALARLTANVMSEIGPVWSPDGTQIAFTSSTAEGNTDIVVINADGSGLTALTPGDGYYVTPVWSPDSTRIAFVGNYPPSGTGQALYTVRRDGTDRLQLTSGGTSIAGLSWSPDGEWIAFASNQGGAAYDLYAIRASGTNLVNLTNSPALSETDPYWQPVTTPGLVIEPQTTQPNPAEQDLLLIYDAAVPVFTLQNVSGGALNLTPLSFTGAGLTVPASIWGEYSASPLDSFKSLGCLMVWPYGLPEQPSPPECGDARQGWITDSSYTFWTQENFTVTYNGAPVATCDTAAGRCTVDLP